MNVSYFFKKICELKNYDFLELNISDYNAYTRKQTREPRPLQRKRISLILDWIEEDSFIVDAGCGRGAVADILKQLKKCKCFGIDISEDAVQEYKKRGFDAIIFDLNQGFPELPSRPDYILFLEVLEHLQFPQRTLLDAKNKARKGIIITLPNSTWWFWRLQMLFGHVPRQSFTHLHMWGVHDFEIFLKKLGFEIIDRKTDTNLFPNLFAYQQAWFVR